MDLKRFWMRGARVPSKPIGCFLPCYVADWPLRQRMKLFEHALDRCGMGEGRGAIGQVLHQRAGALHRGGCQLGEFKLDWTTAEVRGPSQIYHCDVDGASNAVQCDFEVRFGQGDLCQGVATHI